MHNSVFAAFECTPVKLVMVAFLLCQGIGMPATSLLAVAGNEGAGFASRTGGRPEKVEADLSTAAKVPLQTKVRGRQSPDVLKRVLFDPDLPLAAGLA